MKKMVTRYISVPVQVECEVTYYIWAEPDTDPHFRPEKPYVFHNKYFDTKEEAETYLKEWEKDNYFFGQLTVREKETPV